MRDGVDSATGELALTDVVGRDDELQLWNGCEAHRLVAAGPPGKRGIRNTEQVVIDSAVDLEVVVGRAARNAEGGSEFALVFDGAKKGWL